MLICMHEELDCNYKILIFFLLEKFKTIKKYRLTSGLNLKEMNSVNSLGKVLPGAKSSEDAIQI